MNENPDENQLFVQDTIPEQPPSPTPEPMPEPTPEPITYSPQLPPSKSQKHKNSKMVVVALLVACLVGGSFIGYAVTYASLNSKISDLQNQVQYYSSNGQSVNTISTLNDTSSLASLYQSVKSSVVVVQDLVLSYTGFGFASYSQQQGSGFVTTVNGEQVIVTNNHVIESAINITVTFADGESYEATVLGSDANADLAVLNVGSMPSGITSLAIVSSSTLNVGDTVIAVGSPYGLSGTLTAGIVSALGRTITETEGNTNTNIADTIQTSTAINPGNSGGPLIDLQGQVVGITTAAVSNSEGLGFAIPSDTIKREIVSLVNTGSYTQHPALNIQGTDMNLQIAQAMGTSVTYGFLVESGSGNLQGGNQQANILGSRIIIGGDIIIGIGGKTITNTDELLSYLERNTTPGQNVEFTVIRDGTQQTVTVTIGKLS
jgi:S1-C subfamily serine protease